VLERDLGHGGGALNFVMLNPSTADAVRDDPTIRRCIGFARAWGYRRLTVTNLFAYRTASPRTLRHAPDPVGPQNDDFLLRCARQADRIVCAWGTHGALRNREDEVLGMLREHHLEHLGLTQANHPRHPLYVRAAEVPVRYRSTQVNFAPQLPAA